MNGTGEISSFTTLSAKIMRNHIPQGYTIPQYTLKQKLLKYCLKESSIL